MVAETAARPVPCALRHQRWPQDGTRRSPACMGVSGSSSGSARHLAAAASAMAVMQPSTSGRVASGIANSGNGSSAMTSRSGRSSPTAPTGWHPLASPLLWRGTEEEAIFQRSTPYPLTPPWKIMLLSDGSVTRHLQLMADLRVQVECLEMRAIGHERAGLPEAAALLPGPLVQRQVLLHIPDPHSRPYVYATSWWGEATVDEYLRDRSQPIWVSLSRERTELYREILTVELGNCPYLEEQFQAPGPFWGRQYLFWHGGKPLTLIHEVFSTALEGFLGPMQRPEGQQ